MGGAAMPEAGGKGRKKPLDAVVNVVPFIDLLSCCLAFLLITAAWTQLGRLQVAQASGGVGPPPADELTLTVTITEQGFTVAEGNARLDIPRTGAVYDVATLYARLQDIRSRHPTQQTITVAAEDAVAYDTLVATVDTCLKAGLLSVSVQAVS
jgi:biopolymer transport protein TolR